MLYLPSLPWQCVFDILFCLGGMDHLESVFGRDRASVELSKMYYRRRLRWTEVVAACCIMRRLENPAHALLLLCPVDRRIPDSVNAWFASYICTGLMPSMTLNKGLLMRAMKIFLKNGAPAFEWLDVCCIKYKHFTLDEWRKIAKISIANYHFRDRWWKAWRLDSMSIRGSVNESMNRMGPAVGELADEEKRVLLDALRREEKNRIMELKTLQSEKRMKSDPSSKKPPPKPRISPIEARCIEDSAMQSHQAHLKLLDDVATALGEIRAQVFHSRFSRLASIIVRLGHDYPRIKWSLKFLLHSAAVDKEDAPVWATERELCRRATDDAPLVVLKEFGRK